MKAALPPPVRLNVEVQILIDIGNLLCGQFPVIRRHFLIPRMLDTHNKLVPIQKCHPVFFRILGRNTESGRPNGRGRALMLFSFTALRSLYSTKCSRNSSVEVWSKSCEFTRPPRFPWRRHNHRHAEPHPDRPRARFFLFFFFFFFFIFFFFSFFLLITYTTIGYAVPVGYLMGSRQTDKTRSSPGHAVFSSGLGGWRRSDRCTVTALPLDRTDQEAGVAA